MKNLFVLSTIILLYTCQPQTPVTNPALFDNDPSTPYIGGKGKNTLLFDKRHDAPILSYRIYSSGESPEHDPVNWTLKGSYDGKKWIVIDQQQNREFCSRYQEIYCSVQKPSNYKTYLLEANTAHNETLIIGDIQFQKTNPMQEWQKFNCPTVELEIPNPDDSGLKSYQKLVQNPESYIQYHARKVAEILFYTPTDSMKNIETIHYTLKDFKGISLKDGSQPQVDIAYSTSYIEKTAQESFTKLDFETRGILYHELTHAYQFEPQGIGTYSTNKTFWACIEGLADAVRAHAGYLEWDTRKPGGNWMDGYRTTGFFIEWLTTKDPDAIRKFNESARDLKEWSFDKAMKYIFGPTASIESLWDEYQMYLTRNCNNQQA